MGDKSLLRFGVRSWAAGACEKLSLILLDGGQQLEGSLHTRAEICLVIGPAVLTALRSAADQIVRE